MDKHIITRELQILLEAINEQFEIIREYEDFIPQIEFDMIMENVRKLYETFHRLQRLNDPLLFVEKKISGFQDLKNSNTPNDAFKPEPPGKVKDIKQYIKAEPETIPEPAAIPEDAMHPAVDVPVAEPEPVTRTMAAAAEEPSVAPPALKEPETDEPAGIQVRPIIPARPVVKKETQQKRQTKTAELELFAEEEPVFNIRLKEAREKSLGPKISRHDSFKASISINDKFMFINELFDGNLREYNECIETLGGFKTLPQAQEYFDLLRRRNNWNSATPAFRRIKELVEKRF
jgi:hypothetical protein